MHRVERLSIREIGRRRGLHRKTIRRALAAETPPRYARAPTESKLGPFKDWVCDQLQVDRTIQSLRLREMASEPKSADQSPAGPPRRRAERPYAHGRERRRATTALPGRRARDGRPSGSPYGLVSAALTAPNEATAAERSGPFSSLDSGPPRRTAAGDGRTARHPASRDSCSIHVAVRSDHEPQPGAPTLSGSSVLEDESLPTGDDCRKNSESGGVRPAESGAGGTLPS